MGSIHKTPYLYHAGPLFALDIGKTSMKLVQLAVDDPAKPKLIGYGSTPFDTDAIKDGVIVKPEIIAEAAKTLFGKNVVGTITTRRCALTIPTFRTFTRTLELPLLNKKELADAVKLEAEQYIPVPLSDLYLDYTINSRTKTGLQVLLAAIPKAIADSYLELAAIMGLEVVLIEPTMSSNSRLFSKDKQSDATSVLIDIGSVSSDISIYDGSMITTGTIDIGGELFTDAIKKGLDVTRAEANIIKTKYGLDKSRRQTDIRSALEPDLQKVIKEIKRLVRYHAEHYGTDRPIKQIITVGGGANMPGLTDYFTDELRLASRALDPWKVIGAHDLQLPAVHDRPMFATAIGLGLVPPKGVFK